MEYSYCSNHQGGPIVNPTPLEDSCVQLTKCSADRAITDELGNPQFHMNCSPTSQQQIRSDVAYNSAISDDPANNLTQQHSSARIIPSSLPKPLPLPLTSSVKYFDSIIVYNEDDKSDYSQKPI